MSSASPSPTWRIASTERVEGKRRAELHVCLREATDADELLGDAPRRCE